MMADERGDTEKALRYIRKALEVWENADEDHRHVKEARELADKLFAVDLTLDAGSP